jgi:hypothetical protein
MLRLRLEMDLATFIDRPLMAEGKLECDVLKTFYDILYTCENMRNLDILLREYDFEWKAVAQGRSACFRDLATAQLRFSVIKDHDRTFTRNSL